MTTAVAEHVHHWLIETPSGPTCAARCKTCSATRLYSSAGEAQITSEWAASTQRGIERGAMGKGRKKSAFNGVLTPSPRVSVLPVYEQPLKAAKPKPEPKSRVVRPVAPLKRNQERSPQQDQTLEYIRRHGPSKAKAVAEGLGHDRSNTGVRLTALVARGLLEREMNTNGSYTYSIAKVLDLAAVPVPPRLASSDLLTPDGAAVKERGGKVVRIEGL